jgi:hypothetical protein
MEKEKIKLDVQNQLKSRGLKDMSPMNINQISDIVSDLITSRERMVVKEVIGWAEPEHKNDPQFLETLIDLFYEERKVEDERKDTIQRS